MSASTQPSDSPVKILIAEDSPTQAQRQRHILEQQGYEVGVAANGRLALEMAPQFRPALIISDVVMPEMDGYELSRRIKADSGLRDIPVILVTTMSDPQDVIRGLECGADTFVLKPYDEHYLLGRVRYALANREFHQPQDAGMGVELYFNGKKHYITAGRLQILNLLLSTYDATIQRNKELQHSQEALKKRSAEILLANRFLDSVIENIPDMIFVKDAADLRFVRFNRAGAKLLGYSQDDLRGKNDYDFFPKEEADFFTSKDREVLARGVVGDFEVAIHTRNKGARILHAKNIPIFDESDRPRYLLGIARDVTEQKENEREILRLNAALEQRAAEADAANRAKSTFLATMSHEIRTPMNGVLGMIELLSLTRLDAAQRTTLEIVRESGKSLLRIIDDILDFSKIEAGKLEVRPEAASIKEVIEAVRNIYRGTASSNGLLIKCSADSQISPAVLVDPVRLRQILNNFVSNALKFTSAGGTIEIKAELIERDDAENRVRFSVTDTGIGISAEDQQRLFRPFTQVEPNATHRYGGTGLGLTICRRLAEMMGGSIEMVSELGKGTTMILTLSLPIADPKDLPRIDLESARDLRSTTTSMRRMAPSVGEAETEGTLVLLVDDHPINRALLARQVNTLGYAAESAENGLEALDKWKSGRFALVITDCNMPEMDGYELTRGIRRLESGNGGKRTPIIACTANALGGEAEICFAAGMDDYLVKPVELSQILKKLDQWLPIPAVAPSEQSGKRSEVPAPDATAPVDRSVLKAISRGDAAAERDILTDFRRANDDDAAMLKQAVANSDISQVTLATHRITGASRMVGAMGLASACERLEHASRANDWKTVEANMGAFHQEWVRLNAYFDSL